MRVVQFLGMQAVIALMLLLFAFIFRGSRGTMLLCLWTLLMPAGFALGLGRAFFRTEAARSAGTWTPELDRAEGRRGMAVLGAVTLAWILGALAIVLWA